MGADTSSLQSSFSQPTNPFSSPTRTYTLPRTPPTMNTYLTSLLGSSPLHHDIDESVDALLASVENISSSPKDFEERAKHIHCVYNYLFERHPTYDDLDGLCKKGLHVGLMEVFQDDAYLRRFVESGKVQVFNQNFSCVTGASQDTDNDFIEYRLLHWPLRSVSHFF